MYKIINNPITGDQSGVVLLETKTSIPFDPANTDYQEFVQWCEQGNTPEPADEATL